MTARQPDWTAPRLRTGVMGVIGLTVCIASTFAGGDVARSGKQLDRLKASQPLIGTWRGVGQLRRGSRKGAWIEEVQWQWRLDKSVAIVFASPKGKYFRSGELSVAGGKNPVPTAASQALTLKATDPNGRSIHYAGAWTESQLVLLRQPQRSDKNATDAILSHPDRISIRTVAGGKRLVVLFERLSGSRRYTRLSEVGYTRKGSDFGKGQNFVECIVTGGRGTIPVSYDGQTYYVCCTGCRDYFNENPAEAIAEFRQRKKK